MEPTAALLAAEYGQLDCLMHAHKHGSTLDILCCHMSAKNGHIECLKYLHDNDCEWDVKTCVYAAKYGQLKCLKYLHENGCPWEKMTLHHAVKGKHANCAKYFLDNVGDADRQLALDWGTNLCAITAINGDYDTLKLLHETGCLWDERTCRYAVRHGYLQCLKYAYENGCEARLKHYLVIFEQRRLDCPIHFSTEAGLVEYIELAIRKSEACVKIQSIVRGVLVRNVVGVHNPHTVMGKQFLTNMFKSYIRKE
jgi:hypothetical protein